MDVVIKAATEFFKVVPVEQLNQAGFFIIVILLSRMIYRMYNDSIKQQGKLAEHIDKQSESINSIVESVQALTSMVQLMVTSVTKFENLNKGQYNEITNEIDLLKDDITGIKMDMTLVKSNIDRIECNTKDCYFVGKENKGR